MNCILGPEGLVTSLLIFGVLPRFAAAGSELPNQRDHIRTMILVNR